MNEEKDRFGETLKLVERAKEDIYFAERDRELLERLRAQLRKAENPGGELRCPKCRGVWESFTFEGFALERCGNCGGVWLDKGELEGIIGKLSRGPFAALLDKLSGKKE